MLVAIRITDPDTDMYPCKRDLAEVCTVPVLLVYLCLGKKIIKAYVCRKSEHRRIRLLLLQVAVNSSYIRGPFATAKACRPCFISYSHKQKLRSERQ